MERNNSVDRDIITSSWGGAARLGAKSNPMVGVCRLEGSYRNGGAFPRTRLQRCSGIEAEATVHAGRRLLGDGGRMDSAQMF